MTQTMTIIECDDCTARDEFAGTLEQAIEDAGCVGWHFPQRQVMGQSVYAICKDCMAMSEDDEYE